MEELKLRFNDELQKVISDSNDRSNIFTRERYDQILAEVKAAKACKSNGDTISSKQRRRLKMYDILKIGETEKLIERRTDETDEAKQGLEKQAEKMIVLSNSKLPPIDVGTTVIVRVPNVDRGRLAPRNVLAVVLGINDSGLYQLGTKEGTLQSLYCRNEFTLADSNFIDISSVPSTSVSLRTASGLASGSKQGFVQCNCKRYCVDKKCACRAKKIVCNSKCHNNSSCKNK